MTTYNLFISHAWSYSDQYTRLIALLDEWPRFEYRNYSIPKDDPVHNANSTEKLLRAIEDQMRHTHVVVILAGVYSTYSKWINAEIALAKRGFFYAKPILAVEPFDSEKTSSVVKDAADKIVGWRTSSVVEAIRTLV